MRPDELKDLIETLARPRVLVIGDLILDRYVSGDVERISPEAPIAVLNASATQERLGGAGNVAANLRAMEAEVEMVGVIGDDGNGRRLVAMLGEMGVGTAGCVVDPSRPTTEKTRMISGVQQILRVDWEKSDAITAAHEQELLASLAERLERCSAVVLSDYGKGLLTATVLAGVIAAARAAKVPVLVDPKGDDFTRYRGATLVTPNRKEAEEALGHRIGGLDDVPAAARELIDQADLEGAVITLGALGMYHLSRDGASGRVPTVARAVFDVTGAGDTVISHLALALAAGRTLAEAVHLANQAAGIVVGKRGAASVTRDELLESIGGRPAPGEKVMEPEELDHQLAVWRQQGKRIVFTNGCFDVLHVGHVDYLRFSRSKGDVLVIGVNDDASVKRLKGPERPVNPLRDRMILLGALEMVDAVVSYPEDTPARIVERITPDVLVKGEDWRDKGVVGREWVESHGGEVCLAPLVPGRSTTSTLERLRGKAPEGS